MRVELFTIATLFGFATLSAASAQQTFGQDGQANADQSRQTTSAAWSSSGTQQPEQAGDLYQAQTRVNDSFGGATPQYSSGSTLPGALTPGSESLGNGRQTGPKE